MKNWIKVTLLLDRDWRLLKREIYLKYIEFFRIIIFELDNKCYRIRFQLISFYTFRYRSSNLLWVSIVIFLTVLVCLRACVRVCVHACVWCIRLCNIYDWHVLFLVRLAPLPSYLSLCQSNGNIRSLIIFGFPVSRVGWNNEPEIPGVIFNQISS